MSETRRVTIIFEADVPADVDNDQISWDFDEAMRESGTGYFMGAMNIVVKDGRVRIDRGLREIRERRMEGDIPLTSTGPNDFYHGRI